ncbi:DUF2971 domain-containing protein [Pseudoalteromonas piscicida]|uniref:DUF2971 domain-containing protein n=1 Tax=Pseudoalteromonas piscicida TaxID=43662 RepID=UPI00273A002F|nr:DUF2971 domain-containing protein [Pseudoalteromonas piscicida]MDP4488171.1 DUF2971 domain-containing protein [Pseudoalteromonas piscicida]
MILYKYMSFSSAEKIIENSTIGFSGMRFLNDPFEGTYLRASYINQHDEGAYQSFRSRLLSKFAVLSLTRQPLNSLMWAHYGDSHTGVVLGIDIEKASLCDTQTCLIPAQYGDLVYTSKKLDKARSLPSIDRLPQLFQQKGFTHDGYEFFKQAYLYKSLEWAYEEEVRVVKAIEMYPELGPYEVGSDQWERIHLNSKSKNENKGGSGIAAVEDTENNSEKRPLDCLKIPSESIVSAYLGLRTSENNKQKALEWSNKNIELYICTEEQSSWSLVSKSYQGSKPPL